MWVMTRPLGCRKGQGVSHVKHTVQFHRSWGLTAVLRSPRGTLDRRSVRRSSGLPPPDVIARNCWKQKARCLCCSLCLKRAASI